MTNPPDETFVMSHTELRFPNIGIISKHIFCSNNWAMDHIITFKNNFYLQILLGQQSTSSLKKEVYKINDFFLAFFRCTQTLQVPLMEDQLIIALD